ncbi:MAG: hypothetical protein HC859_05370, partial [Bacteroidia bacterium]|nr:hypothetical protein [Bacteroidia bacterium]
EGCGASCSSWTRFFNYSTTSGNYLEVTQVIDTTGRFRQMVLKDKDTEFEKRRNELRKLMSDKSSGVDQDTFDWVAQQMDECNRAFTLETFSLHPDRLEIIAYCDLPNAIKNLSPNIRLPYKYADVAPYMRVKVR